MISNFLDHETCRYQRPIISKCSAILKCIAFCQNEKCSFVHDNVFNVLIQEAKHLTLECIYIRIILDSAHLIASRNKWILGEFIF